MTTEEIRERLRYEAGRLDKKEYPSGLKIYGKMPSAWGMKQVHECFGPSRFVTGSKKIKSYRDYLIVLFDDGENILARLCRKEADSNVHVSLESPELKAII